MSVRLLNNCQLRSPLRVLRFFNQPNKGIFHSVSHSGKFFTTTQSRFPSSKLFSASLARFRVESAVNKKNDFPSVLKIHANSHVLAARRIIGRANAVRFYANTPYTPLTPPDREGLKKIIALSGAAFTFWYLKSNVVINGIIAFAAYKLIKSSLNLIWPPRNPYYATEDNPLFSMSQDWSSFWSLISPSSKTFRYMQDAIDELHALSVKQIQMAYENNYDDLKNQYGGLSSSSIGFSTPHSVSSQSLGFGTIGAFKKQNSVKIEYWTTGRNGRRALVRVKGSCDHGNVKVEEISIYWTHTGEWLDIPLRGFDNFQQYEASKPPDIFEAEYRDIKKNE